eukprot:m.30252 g.30252  ORF g.30252 m.30252 type:complete len:267 (-) comp9396_c1_seq1:276-1076(-)
MLTDAGQNVAGAGGAVEDVTKTPPPVAKRLSAVQKLQKMFDPNNAEGDNGAASEEPRTPARRNSLDKLMAKGSVRKTRSKVLEELRTNSLSDLSYHEQLAFKLKTDEEEVAAQKGGKLVVYTTSLRAVQSIASACDAMIKLLVNLRVEFEERDVFLHKHFAQELQARLGDSETPAANLAPHVFLNGASLGDYPALLLLNENGKLMKVLEDVPLTTSFREDCDLCAGRSFVTCTWCHGDQKSFARFVTLKCTACNESGLVHCPQCKG